MFKKEYPSVYDHWLKLNGQFELFVHDEVLHQKIIEFNTTYGYLIPEYKWSFISRSQTLLKRKLFSFSRICLNSGFIYPLQNLNSHLDFEQVFSFFNLRVLETGFQDIWETFSYRDINFRYLRMTSDQWTVLGFEYFEVAWWILVLGNCLSGVVFVIEQFVFK